MKPVYVINLPNINRLILKVVFLDKRPLQFTVGGPGLFSWSFWDVWLKKVENLCFYTILNFFFFNINDQVQYFVIFPIFFKIIFFLNNITEKKKIIK